MRRTPTRRRPGGRVALAGLALVWATAVTLGATGLAGDDQVAALLIVVAAGATTPSVGLWALAIARYRGRRGALARLATPSTCSPRGSRRRCWTRRRR